MNACRKKLTGRITDRVIVALLFLWTVCILMPACVNTFPENNNDLTLALLISQNTGSTTLDAARITSGSTQTLSDATATSIAFNTENFDQGNFFDSATPDRMIAPQLDIYFMSASAGFLNNATGRRMVSFSGDSVLLRDIRRAISTGQDTSASMGVLQQLSAGQILQLELLQNSGGNLNTIADDTTNFAVARMDRAVAGAARARTTAGHNIIDSTPTVITYHVEDYDTGGFYDLSQPDRMIASASGIYLVSAHGLWANTANGSRGIELFMNGTTSIARDMCEYVPADFTGQGVSTIIQLQTGDYISARAFQTSGGGVILQSGAVLEMARLDSTGASTREIMYRRVPDGFANLATGVDTFLTLSNVLRADSAYDTTNVNRTTILKDGIYLMVANLQIDANAANRRRMELMVNSTTILSAYKRGIGAGGTTLNIVTLYKFTAGDYVEVRVNQDSGSALAYVYKNSFLQMIKLD